MSYDGSEGQPFQHAFSLHDHIAFICGRPEHWRKLVVSFFREGLANNQRCLYLNGLYHPQQAYALLVREDLPVGAARLARRLAINPATEYFLSDGSLAPEATLSKLHQEVALAKASGCSGLRLLVDMNWSTYFFGGSADLIACEMLLNNSFIPNQPCLSVCHYERVLFPPKLIHIVSAHHQAVLDGDLLMPFSGSPERPMPLLTESARSEGWS